MRERSFIVRETAKLLSVGIKIFPEDFCDLYGAAEIDLPGENLVLSKDFLGTYEVTAIDGKPIFSFTDLYKAKFIVYSSRRRIKKIRIPEDSHKITGAVKKYESYLDQLLKEIKSNFYSENLHLKNIGIVSGEIFKKLNLIRL